MSGQGTYAWNASERKWGNSLLRAGQYLTKLHGSAKTGLYATQRGKEEHWGEVFSLDEDTTKCVTRFYYDVTHDPPGFHVFGKDRFLNWGGGKLRVYAKGEWSEQPADLPQVGTLVFDAENSVTLYAKGRLYNVDRNNKVVVAESDAGISRKATKGALWGHDEAIVLEYGAVGVTGLDLCTGHVVDTKEINLALDGRPVYDLFSTPNGAVWVMAFDRALASYVLFRVSPGGTATLVRDTAGIPWDNHQFTHSPRSVLMDRHGSVWFACYKLGVFRLADGKLSQFDHRIDNSPAASGVLLEGRNGVIYAGTATGLYAYNNGASLTGAAPETPIPTSTLRAPVWRRDVPPALDRLSKAWYVGGLVFYLSRYGSALTALDPLDGAVRFSIPVSRDEADPVWVTAGSSKGELTVCLKDRVCAVDAGTGAILRSVECKLDRRIAPIAVGDSYILVKQYRGDTVSRVKASGEDAWTSRLSGYVMTHPSAFGPLLLLQTRQGSYGGQASWGLEANTGEQLWNDTVNAYGAGTAFADDARYCVESDCYLAPDTTEAWLIARDPWTGVRRWHYRKPGTTVDHAPLIDTVNDRVYGALGNGTIVCLDGVTGAAVWETVLPQPPASAPAASYEPYAHCMSLFAATLAVVTADQLLYLIRTTDGAVLHRVALTADTVRDGRRTGSPRLIAGPWVVGNLLIVPSETGIAAHSLDGLEEAEDEKAVGFVP